MEINSYEDCLELLKEFIARKLDNDIEKLIIYDFNNIKEFEEDDYKRFGVNDKRKFDCDDTNLARAMYVLLWGAIFPELEFNEIGTNKSIVVTR